MVGGLGHTRVLARLCPYQLMIVGFCSLWTSTVLVPVDHPGGGW